MDPASPQSAEYQIQAVYSGEGHLSGRSAAQAADVDKSATLKARVVRGPSGDYYLVTWAVPPTLSSIRLRLVSIHNQLFPAFYPRFALERESSCAPILSLHVPEVLAGATIELQKQSTGRYLVPEAFAPSYGGDYGFEAEAVLSNGKVGPRIEVRFLGALQGPYNDGTWKTPALDGRSHLEQNARFLARAAGDFQPFRYALFPKTCYTSVASDNYLFADFYRREGGADVFLDEFGPFQENRLYRNWVLRSVNTDLSMDGEPNSGVEPAPPEEIKSIAGASSAFSVFGFVDSTERLGFRVARANG